MQWSQVLKEKRRFLLDGAMGSQLHQKGLKAGSPLNSLHGATIEAIHRSYLQVGAEGIVTNTFTANALYYAKHYPDASWEDENKIGAQLALHAAAGAAVVLGDMGPTGHMLPPFGDASESELTEAFAAQAQVLASAGVQGFLVESLVDVQEACCAVDGIRQVSNLPILVSFAFTAADSTCRTMMGHTAGQAVKALASWEIQGIGGNCGQLAPVEMAFVTASFNQLTSLPIVIRPNIGRPHIHGNVNHNSIAARNFAEELMESVQQGASVVGGCCGTTPEHIRHLAALLGKNRKTWQ